jgi:hypothetical protein
MLSRKHGKRFVCIWSSLCDVILLRARPAVRNGNSAPFFLKSNTAEMLVSYLKRNTGTKGLSSTAVNLIHLRRQALNFGICDTSLRSPVPKQNANAHRGFNVRHEVRSRRACSEPLS